MLEYFQLMLAEAKEFGEVKSASISLLNAAYTFFCIDGVKDGKDFHISATLGRTEDAIS